MNYVEHLTVPVRWWAQGTMLVASLWLAVLVATPEHEAIAWIVAAVSLGLMIALFTSYGSARVGVEDDQLFAGRAHIPLGFVGKVDELDAEGLRRLAGVDADARAYLLLRPYVKRGVRVDVTDPTDPAPYWLVACRRPEALMAALESARQS